MLGIAWWENYIQNFPKKENILSEIGHFGGCVLLVHNQNQGWLPPEEKKNRTDAFFLSYLAGIPLDYILNVFMWTTKHL